MTLPSTSIPRPGLALWRNVAQLGTAKVLNRGLGFAWSVVLARSLGVSGFGEYTYLVALTILLSLFAEGGFTSIVSRDVATDLDQIKRTVPTAMGLTVLFNLVACILLIGIAVIDTPTPGRLWRATLAAAYLPANGMFNVVSAVFRGRNRFDYDSAFNVINVLVFAALSAVALLLGWGVAGVVGAYVVRMYVVLAAATIVCARRIGVVGIALVADRARYLFKEGLPLVLSGAAAQVYVRIDIVILSLVAGTDAVAVYSVASRFADALTTAATALGFASLPLLAEMWRDDPRRAHRFARTTTRRTVMLAALALALGVAIARPLIRHLYGLPFAAGGPVLQILLITVPLYAVSQISSTLLIAAARQRVLVWIFGGAALVSIALNFFLASRWLYFGSAGAAVATSAVVTVALWLSVARSEREHRAYA